MVGDVNKALAQYGGFVTKDPSKYVQNVTQGAQQQTQQTQRQQRQLQVRHQLQVPLQLPQPLQQTRLTLPITIK